MTWRLPAIYKSILGSAIKYYKSFGIFGWLASYCLIGFFYLGLPACFLIVIEWLLGTNKGWPAIVAVIYFVLVSLPLLPVLFVMVALFGEWLLNVTRANRLFDISDYALRNAVEKWTQR
jgi:hypothetical protein